MYLLGDALCDHNLFAKSAQNNQSGKDKCMHTQTYWDGEKCLKEGGNVRGKKNEID